MREVPEDSFDVVVELDLESLGAVRAAVEAALRERERASAAQEAASTAVRHAVSEVRASGYTSRDAGMLLRVSATSASARSSVSHRMVPRKTRLCRSSHAPWMLRRLCANGRSPAFRFSDAIGCIGTTDKRGYATPTDLP